MSPADYHILRACHKLRVVIRHPFLDFRSDTSLPHLCVIFVKDPSYVQFAYCLHWCRVCANVPTRAHVLVDTFTKHAACMPICAHVSFKGIRTYDECGKEHIRSRFAEKKTHQFLNSCNLLEQLVRCTHVVLLDSYIKGFLFVNCFGVDLGCVGRIIRPNRKFPPVFEFAKVKNFELR